MGGINITIKFDAKEVLENVDIVLVNDTLNLLLRPDVEGAL